MLKHYIISHWIHSFIHSSSQGEDAASDRKISKTVGLQEIPNIMQAMGFYPTNQEIEDMVNEVKFSKYSTANEKEIDFISFTDLIKCN